MGSTARMQSRPFLLQCRLTQDKEFRANLPVPRARRAVSSIDDDIATVILPPEFSLESRDGCRI